MRKIFNIGIIAISAVLICGVASAESLSPEDQTLVTYLDGADYNCMLEKSEGAPGFECEAHVKYKAQIKARNICFSHGGEHFDRGFYCGTSPVSATAMTGYSYEVAKTFFGQLSSEQVKGYQREFKANGYYSGSIDGKFGPGTARALETVLRSEAELEGKNLDEMVLTYPVIETYLFNGLALLGD